MWPGASVSGLYFAHPEAKYFGVGKVNRDQVIDYQQRKQMDLQTVERWLGPYLNYEPGPIEQPGFAPATTNDRPAACSCAGPRGAVLPAR